MKKITAFFVLAIAVGSLMSFAPQKGNPYYSHTDNKPVNISNAEWKKILPSDAYNILREEGTEPAGTGKYAHNYDKGTYYCAGCGHPLFSSATKFDSHTGWPSFYQPLTPTSVKNKADNSYGMDRTEVVCARCGGHLGHVFDDGPAPTHLRYCMNSAALNFEKGK